MKKLLLKSILLVCALVVGTSSSWAEPITLFHESFGDNSGSARDWSDSYSVKSGVSAVYSGITGYTVSNAKQGKNTTGSTKSGLNQSSQGTDAYIIIGPLNVASYSSLALTYQWKAASIKGTYSTSLYYKTSAGGDFAEVSGTGTGATSFVERSYSLPAAAQVSTLYLKIVWNTSNTQAIIDEVDLAGTESGGGGSSDPSISLSSLSVNAAEAGANGTINVTYSNIASVNSEVKFYESNGTTETTYDWITASINASNNLEYSIIANTGAARTAYMKVHQKNTEVYSGLITISQEAKTVVAPSFNLDGNKSYWQGTELTLTSEGNTIYYTSTTDGTDPANPTAGSTEYTAPIALPSSSYKIKAIAYDVYGNASSVVTRTYTGVAVATLPFSWDEKETSTTGVISSSVGTYDSKPYLKFDATDDNLILHFDGVPGTLSFDIKGNSFSGGIFTVQTSSDGSAYTDLASYTTLGDKETKSYKLSADVRYIKWIYTNKSSGNVALGNINLLPVPDEPTTPTVDDVAHTVTLATTANMAGWRTFAPVKDDQSYTVEGTTKVYYASATADGKVTLTEIADGVPANTPVILHQTSGTTITLTETATDITAPGSNLLQVSTASQDLGTVYRLGYKSTYGVGFYTYTTNSAPAGIIYLSSVSTARDYLEFTFDDETTGVDDVRSKMSDGRSEYFNLAGQRVAQPTKGLYIVNGKKYVIK